MNNSRRLSIKRKMAELTLEGWVGVTRAVEGILIPLAPTSARQHGGGKGPRAWWRDWQAVWSDWYMGHM